MGKLCYLFYEIDLFVGGNMKGKILGYSKETGEGTIVDDTGKRYSFTKEEWKENNSEPLKGMTVDFDIDGSKAVAIYTDIMEPSIVNPAKSSKDKVAAGLLAIFLGGLGIHKFYLGYTGAGLVYLLTNTIGFAFTWVFLFIPNIILGIMALIEGIIYLTKTDEEFNETYVIGNKPWF